MSPQPPSPLRARRLMLGLRQIDVAELADLSREQVIRLEAGTSAPGQRTAERLAIALRTKPDALFPSTDAENALVNRLIEEFDATEVTTP